MYIHMNDIFSSLKNHQEKKTRKNAYGFTKLILSLISTPNVSRATGLSYEHHL